MGCPPLVAILLCGLLAAASSAKKLNFFQISDLHLDARYSEDGRVQNACHNLESNDRDDAMEYIGYNVAIDLSKLHQSF